MRDRTRGLVASFGAFPEPHIPVTVTQFMTVIEDAELPAQVSQLIRTINGLGHLDFASPKAIGTVTRRGLIDAIAEAEAVRDETRRLATFRAPLPLAELPDVIVGLAVRAANLIAEVVEAASAETALEAIAANQRLQALLGIPLGLERLSELLAVGESMMTPDDLDARAALATGITARYTDDLGFLDPARIFSAAVTLPSPLDALAEGAGRYLSHLLDTPVDALPSGAAILVLCAVPLAVVDRPFAAHRVADLVRGLLRQAAARASAELADAFSIYDERQGRVFSAATRARREARLIEMGQIEKPVEVVESLVEIYKRLAEGPYRAAMRLLMAARAAAEGLPAPPETPLLGQIDDVLAGWESDLAGSLRGAVDRSLRNAEAHDDYHVDPKTLDVVVDGHRIDLEQLKRALSELTALIAAMEAAILCYRIDTGNSFPTPAWLADGQHPDAAAMIVQAIAGAWALEVTEIVLDDEVSHLTVAGPVASDPQLARRLIVSSTTLAPRSKEWRALLPDGTSVAMGIEAIRAWQSAPADEEDLAFVELIHDSQVRSGAPPDEALADAIAAQLRLIINQDLQQIDLLPRSEPVRRRLAGRLRRVARFAAAHDADSAPATSAVFSEVTATRDAASAAIRIPKLLPRAIARLVELAPWADSRAIPYPNEALRYTR